MATSRNENRLKLVKNNDKNGIESNAYLEKNYEALLKALLGDWDVTGLYRTVLNYKSLIL